ncbi:MAG: pilus assembly PilX N-terminal domain-containing protein [Candidatus Saccharibacteria bacterium]|nr:pilus assembly PilX N-terminal domain-containing protein [Rhodoferax sp.]
MAKASGGQSGATLIVGLIMLVLITLIVLSAFTFSLSNLKSVGNMQVREEAIAAANLAIEQVIASPFTDAPTAQEINVDINKDGTTDFVVKVEAPTCIKALIASSPGNTQIGFNTGGGGSTWDTEWDINSRATDAASGASVQIRQGIRVRLSDVQKNLVCP